MLIATERPLVDERKRRVAHAVSMSLSMQATTEIRRNPGDSWKVTHMNIGLHPVE
jgi:hypothetical protein